MMSVAQQDAGRRLSQFVCNQANFHNKNLSDSYNFPDFSDLDTLSIGFLPQANNNIEQTSEIMHQQNLTNGPDSLNLCLSALIGLGLCSSIHFVKKMSFGFVPEWFHNGGPFQIGHSHAVMPESLYTPVCCFVQPLCKMEDSFAQYRLRTVVSLWRKSQFTPAVIASRGPPNMS
jgi:hypothetical protein